VVLKVTDAGLKILSSMKNLTSLDLSGCDQSTDASLGHISGLTNLTSLNLSECSKITDAGVNWLKEHLPNLTIYRKYY